MVSQAFPPVYTSDLSDQVDEKNPFLAPLLFFLLFFSIFLFLSVVYLCNRRNQIVPGLLAGIHAGILPWNSRPATMGRLDAATIDGFPTFSYGSSVSSNNKTNQDGECCICLSIFEEGDQLKALPLCHHGFHSECVDKWLKTRSTCPLCRAPVLQDSSRVSMAAEV